MNQIQMGCSEGCQPSGTRLLAQPVDVTDPTVGDQVRGLVTETHVDGVILSSPVTDCVPVLKTLEHMEIPFVRISPGTNHAMTASVFMDDAQAADDMTTFLINKGHRAIGFIKGHGNHMASEERLFGYRRALDRAGLPFEPALVAPGAFDYDSGVAAARRFLNAARRPSAIFASNDDMAAATVAIAHRSGLDVPGDLTVCGFDDTSLATTIWPELTTIRQPISAMSRAAVEVLVQMLRARRSKMEAEPAHLVMEHQLIRRQSDAPPRVRPNVGERS